MLKIRVENTCTSETFDLECDGAVITTCNYKDDNCTVKTIIRGGFNVRILKSVRKNINKLFKEIL